MRLYRTAGMWNTLSCCMKIPAELEDKEEAEKLLPESAPDTHRTLKGEWFH